MSKSKSGFEGRAALATVTAIQATRGNVDCENPWELEGAEGTVGKGVACSLEGKSKISKES